MIDIQKYCNNLLDRRDLFFRPSKVSAVSYPIDGSNLFYKIEDESYWFKHRNNCILKLLRKNMIKVPLFDIGGGNGVVSSFLKANGYEVAMIEPSEHGCINASKRGLENIVNGTFEDCNFIDNSLSTVAFFDVIEHIQNDLDFIREVYKKIIPGGFIVITVPAYRFLWSYEDIEAGHFKRYTARSLSQLLKDSGFEIVSIRSFFSFLILPIFFIRTIPYYFGKKALFSVNECVGSKRKSKVIDFFISVFCKIDLWQSRTIKLGSSLIVLGKKR